MKKILFTLTFTTLLFVGCSSNSDDDSNTQQTNPATTQYFHPPTWIQGSWGYSNGTTLVKSHRFTNNDFLITNGNNETSYKGAISSHPYGGSVDETIDASNYNFTIVT